MTSCKFLTSALKFAIVGVNLSKPPLRKLPNIFGNWIGIGRAECQDKVLHDARYMFYCKTIKFQFIWKLKVGSKTLIFKDNDEID